MKFKVAQVRWAEMSGGPERMLRDLAAYLDRTQFDMRFFFLGHGGPYAEELQAMGYPVEVIPARNGYDPVMRFNLLRRLRAFGPHIIHDHGVPPLVRPFLRLATSATLLGFEHGEIEINRRKGKPWLNWLNGIDYHLFVRQVMVNSAANAQLVCVTHGLSMEQVKVVHLGIDLRQFPSSIPPRTATEEEILIIGYVGRLQNYDKGVDYLPQLAHKLVQMGLQKFRLRIVGDGPDRVAVQTLAEQLKVAEYLEFLGRRTDIPALMADMDILVLPSRMEAFGLVGLEALAAGMRIAAFSLPGIQEILAGCAKVRLVPPGDLPALAHAVLDLWQQNGKQRDVAAQKYVAENFSAQCMVRKIEQSYLAFERKQ